MNYKSKDRSNNRLLSFLRLQLSEVKFQFTTFEDVSVSSTALTRSAGDGGEETAGCKLFIDGSFQLGHTLADLVFLLGRLGPLLVEDGFLSLSLKTEERH